jgi:hypothetical protein
MEKYKLIKEHIMKWQRSGESIRSYCKRNELSEDSFYHWRKKYAGKGNNTQSKSLVPIEIEKEKSFIQLERKSSLTIKIDPNGSIIIEIGNRL